MRSCADWDDVKLLTVRVDRARRWWRPGLLCIGDAAHAMSPIGGVGINLAIQDAVAAANRLAGPLREDRRDAGPPAGGAAAPRVADPGHPAHPGARPGSRHHPGPGPPGTAPSPAGPATPGALVRFSAGSRAASSASGSARSTSTPDSWRPRKGPRKTLAERQRPLSRVPDFGKWDRQLAALRPRLLRSYPRVQLVYDGPLRWPSPCILMGRAGIFMSAGGSRQPWPCL